MNMQLEKTDRKMIQQIMLAAGEGPRTVNAFVSCKPSLLLEIEKYAVNEVKNLFRL